MVSRKTFCCVTVALALLVSAGCSKKVLKAPPETKPPQEAPAPAVEAPPPAAPADSFKAEEPDSLLKQTLVPIYFDYDKYDLRRDAVATLEKIAALLNQKPALRLLIEGNADERGSSEYNMGLGQNRASSAKTYLVNYGISANRIETTSFGKERPAYPNCGEDESCHAKNRRDEWKVLK